MQCTIKVPFILWLLFAVAINFTDAIFGNISAHEIPASVHVNAFVKPGGNRLELLIRVPMAALQEIDYPTKGPGYLQVSRAEPSLRNATKVWLTDRIEVYEDGRRLDAPQVAALRVSLPSDRSFGSFDEARAHLLEPPLADDLDLYWNQQLLDVLIVYPIASDRSSFAIHPRIDRLGERVSMALRFMAPGEPVRALEFHGDPGLVALDPSWHQAVLTFTLSGFWHILGGIDHLLFLLCLVLPFRRLRPLVLVVTSFTVAHSISLIASAFGFVPDALWFPPLVETGIAATIVYMALENIVGTNVSRRWALTFAFGLVHGFGFSFALREELQFAGDHLVTSLLAFNLGVEIGQLLVLVVLIPALDLLFKHATGQRLGIVILSALVAHTAWHWMIERYEQLAQFPAPTFGAAFVVDAMRGGMGVLGVVGAILAAQYLLGRRRREAFGWVAGAGRRTE